VSCAAALNAFIFCYDNPICDSPFASGAEPFDVQEAGKCLPEFAAGERIITNAGSRCHPGRGGISENYQAGCRSNSPGNYFLLSPFGGQDPLSRDRDHACRV
jgi:hypothetical protein